MTSLLSQKMLTVSDPQTGDVVGEVKLSTPAEARVAIEQATRWFETSSPLSAGRRSEILQNTAAFVQSRHETFSQTIASEGVKTIREARKEVTRCVQTLQLFAGEATRIHGETIPFGQVDSGVNKFGYYERRPLGVVAAITPFNDPLNLVAHKLAPAVATGNAVVLKPHPETPLSAVLLAEAFFESGLPADSLKLIHGGKEVGEAIVSDSRVNMVSFTGGYETGHRITQIAGVKKVAMELGGIGVVVVAPDADLDAAAESITSGAFWAAGQNCVHVQRVLVHQSIEAPFTERFVNKTRRLKQGAKCSEQTDVGCLIDLASSQRVASLVEASRKQGGAVLWGGEYSGVDFQPTIVRDDRPSAPLANQEVFGPVTLVQPYESLDHAIASCNQSRFALHAGIFTQNVKDAFHAVSRIRCGGVMVNESTDFRIDAMPFGGFKHSGVGREGGRYAIEAMTEPSVVCFNL